MNRYRYAFLLMTLVTALSTLWTYQVLPGRALPLAALVFALFFRKSVASLLTLTLAAVYTAGVYGWLGTEEFHLGGAAIDIALFLFVFLTAAVVGTLISDIEDAVAHLIPTQIGRDMPDEAACREQFEHEVRRARRFDRPLSLIGFRLEDEASAPCPPLVHELLRRYAMLSVQGMMAEEITQRTMDSDIIAVRNGLLVAMLPETPGTSADKLLSRLRRPLEMISGSRIRVAKVEFPGDESTLSGMLDHLDHLLLDDAAPQRFSRQPVDQEDEAVAQ